MAMKKPLTYAAILMMGTALTPFTAYAQTSDDQVAETDATDPDQDADADDDFDDDVEISGPGAGDQPITVIGRFIPNPVRNQAEVVSVLSAEEIARTADGDIAGSLSRVTGLSTVGGRFVFVRGLGDRYSSALLNGLPLPSPEPLRRTVPLDLFPSSIIGSTVITKSYSASYPGEFGGGVINLTTRSIPDEPFLKIGGTLGYNSETTLETGFTFRGGDTDFLGFDDGTRDLPPGLQNAFDNNIPVISGDAGLPESEIDAITAGLNDPNLLVIQGNNDIPFNGDLNLSAGTNFYVGEAYIGVIAQAGWRNGFRTRGGRQELAGIPSGDGTLGLLSGFDYLTTQNRVVVNGLLGFVAEVGEHKLRWTNFFVRDTAKEARIRQGFRTSIDADAVLNEGRTSTFERQLFNTQIVTEFDFGDLDVDVRASYANAQRNSPFEFNSGFALNENFAGSGQDVFVNGLGQIGNGEFATIAFSELDDDTIGFGIDFAYDLPFASGVTLKTGYAYTRNTRDSLRRDFEFVPAGDALPAEVSQQRIDFLLSDFNVQEFDVEVQEFFGVAGAQFYAGELEVQGLYVEVDAELVDGLRLQAGVRYETSDQQVSPQDIFGLGSVPIVPTDISESDFLPAATLTWNFAEDMQFRVAASQTLARPQFRELANQQFLDFETDRVFFGNEFLQNSSLTNLEARYEWYTGRDERISAAFFYKDIQDPIELIAFAQGDSARFTTFANAPSAELFGLELEVVQYFDLFDLGGDFWEERRLLLAANYTFTDSSINVTEDDMILTPFNPGTLSPAAGVFDDGDRLVGQSRHLANVQFGLEKTGEQLSQQTFILSYNSPRVTNRGTQGQPDLFEEPGVLLDFVWREGIQLFGKTVQLQFEARNILGESYIEFQENEVSRVIANSYDYGTSVSFGVNIEF
ncbi:TonB-dependent receptor domain-containing protein [Parasphingorhabdus sp. DH2-15]|uniref:TonB-dependent receptor domain-containing protein n=1 Tax=Parasphingorhabdus sp. DH2-15 TaxID=3444112 RepID=UPI003F6842C8